MKKLDTKRELYVLIEKIPVKEIPTVKKMIELLMPYLKKHQKSLSDDEYLDYLDSLPEEDEELSDEEMCRIEKSRNDIREGRVHSWEYVAEELDL